jgi:hypothetical protein
MLLRKKHILLVFILLSILSAYSQDSYFMNRIDSVRYFPATSEPNLNWRQISYDDSSWELGGGIIGFGDITDIKINPVNSLYTRSYFNIESIDDYNEIILFCDFDDGFAAYINGVEFARVNLGNFGSEIAFNQLADRSHEGQLVKFANDEIAHPVMGYYIDKAFIDSVFVVGQNVLSIQVHNDSINGSDLSIFGGLVNRTGIEYNIFDLFARYKKSVQLDSSILPIIKIESNEHGIPFKRIEVPATLGVINNGAGKYNKPGDTNYEHFGNIQIEVRGESSAIFPKRSYDFELRDAEDKDTSVALLGMPRESDWILQGPFADKSQIRNALIYELGRKTGHWNPRVKFCEVILNGEYLGLYNLIEKIKRDSNRINIAKLRDTEIEGTDLTGGYILKYDKPDGEIVNIVYPKEKNLQPEQQNYILNFIEEYESTLYSNDGLNEDTGYKKYIDENTLVDYMIIAEFAKNCDSYLYSTYFYKNKIDRDNRIKFGPLWDFDLCFGNSIWQEGFLTYNWQFDYPLNDAFHITRLFEDPSLVDKFEDRWFELREGMLHTDSIFSMIDSLTSTLSEPIKRNFEVWPVENKGVFFPVYIAPDYRSEIDSIKAWITKRVTWMDENISTIYYPVTEFTNTESTLADKSFEASVYPNPFTNEFLIDLVMPESGKLLVELIDIQSRTVDVIENTQILEGEYKIYWNQGNNEIPQGLYLIKISMNGKFYHHLRVLRID